MSILFEVELFLMDQLFHSMKEMGEYPVSSISEGSSVLFNEGDG